MCACLCVLTQTISEGCRPHPSAGAKQLCQTQKTTYRSLTRLQVGLWADVYSTESSYSGLGQLMASMTKLFPFTVGIMELSHLALHITLGTGFGSSNRPPACLGPPANWVVLQQEPQLCRDKISLRHETFTGQRGASSKKH